MCPTSGQGGYGVGKDVPSTMMEKDHVTPGIVQAYFAAKALVALPQQPWSK
jgi:hypothetical protein